MRLLNVVDIGASPHGGSPPYKPLLDAGLCRVTGFEPHPEELATLRAIRSQHETYLPYVIGDGKEHMLQICTAPSGMTSLLEPDPVALSHFPGFIEWGRVLRREVVQTRRFDDVTEVVDPDFLKIDIQGGELAVFQHGRRQLKSIVAIQAEVSFIPLYLQQPRFADIDAELRAQGFVFHTFVSINRRTLTPTPHPDGVYAGYNQVLEADVLYVKDWQHLDRLSFEQLEALMTVAVLYRSPDLVTLCRIALQQQRDLAVPPAS